MIPVISPDNYGIKMLEEYSLMKDTDELPPKGKLRWNCRRGMKELEVIFLPFLEYCYDSFDEPAQRDFVRLLGFDDASLYAWFMGYESPADQRIAAIIQEVQSAVTNAMSGNADFSSFT